MKPGAILAALLAIGGLGLGVFAFVSGASPYVTAKEAATRPDEFVHVAGDIDHASASATNGVFTFELVDEKGDRLHVVYQGMKPGNFDSAPTASVAGKYHDGVFVTEKITTQCPSKYKSKPSSVATSS